MATCPRCGRYLGGNHRCRGLWRLRLRAFLAIAAAAVAGGVGSWLFAMLMYEHASPAFVLLIAVTAGLVQHVLMLGEPQSEPQPAKPGK